MDRSSNSQQEKESALSKYLEIFQGQFKGIKCS